MTTYTVELTTTKSAVVTVDSPEELLEWITDAEESDYQIDYRYPPSEVIYDEAALETGEGKTLPEFWSKTFGRKHHD